VSLDALKLCNALWDHSISHLICNQVREMSGREKLLLKGCTRVLENIKSPPQGPTNKYL
jgi:hypothetical protein